MIDSGKIWENCERIERVAESETPMETHQGAITERTIVEVVKIGARTKWFTIQSP